MAAPSTENNVTVRRLSSLITQLWTKITSKLSGKLDVSLVNGTPTAADKVITQSYADAIGERLEARYLSSNAAGDPFATYAALRDATTFYYQGQALTTENPPDTNDITVVSADENHKNGNNEPCVSRYRWNRYDTTSGKNIWNFEYVINNSGLSSTQLAAVNSGITSTKVSTYDGYADQFQPKGEYNVFIANYNTTTYADIMTAYNAGKVCICIHDDQQYLLNWVKAPVTHMDGPTEVVDEVGEIHFNGVHYHYWADRDAHTIAERIVTSANVWSDSVFEVPGKPMTIGYDSGYDDVKAAIDHYSHGGTLYCEYNDSIYPTNSHVYAQDNTICAIWFAAAHLISGITYYVRIEMSLGEEPNTASWSAIHRELIDTYNTPVYVCEGTSGSNDGPKIKEALEGTWYSSKHYPICYYTNSGNPDTTSIYTYSSEKYDAEIVEDGAYEYYYYTFINYDSDTSVLKTRRCVYKITYDENLDPTDSETYWEDPVIANTDIFWCEYGTTPFNDISAAIANKKLPMFDYSVDGGVRTFVYHHGESITRGYKLCFYSYYGSGFYYTGVDNNSSWYSVNSVNLQNALPTSGTASDTYAINISGNAATSSKVVDATSATSAKLSIAYAGSSLSSNNFSYFAGYGAVDSISGTIIKDVSNGAARQRICEATFYTGSGGTLTPIFLYHISALQTNGTLTITIDPADLYDKMVYTFKRLYCMSTLSLYFTANSSYTVFIGIISTKLSSAATYKFSSQDANDVKVIRYGTSIYVLRY